MVITFLIKVDPFSWKTHEALRLAIAGAITHEVNVIFVNDGVFAITKWDPERVMIGSFEKIFMSASHLENIKFYVENESLKVRGLEFADFYTQATVINREDIKKILNDSDNIFAF